MCIVRTSSVCFDHAFKTLRLGLGPLGRPGNAQHSSIRRHLEGSNSLAIKLPRCSAFACVATAEASFLVKSADSSISSLDWLLYSVLCVVNFGYHVPIHHLK